MNNIREIVKSLGYHNSDFLFYKKDILNSEKLIKILSIQKKRILEDINPDAFFCVDGLPFILFFEIISDKDKSVISKKVWNAQIPVVFFIYDDKIEIFNGYSLNVETEELSIVKTYLYDEINENCDFSFWNISNEVTWLEYNKQFSTPKIDNILLDNIKCINNLLKKSKCEPFAVILVLRLIFIRYLIDRGVDLDYKGFSGSIDDSQHNFLNILKDKQNLYDLFGHLEKKFNGNLFEFYCNEAGEKEIDLIDDQSLSQLYDLMSGELEIGTGQFSLFPLYDFNIIPIELVSNIYERFLGDERQKKDSAFYTPPYLVDYILKQTIISRIKNNDINNYNIKIMDPACGSGIFLVESLRSIIETAINNNQVLDDKSLIGLVTNNIYGVDKNPEAINVAIFSIYITLLDYKNPKTLKSFKLPYLKDKNFLIFDFFDRFLDEKISHIKFDYIIGNPPWGRMNNGRHIEYCKENNYAYQNNEISRSFIYRTNDFASSETQIIFIVTSKLFYNSQMPAVNFRKWLLSNSRINLFIELAAVRELIFQNARGPATIISYNFSQNPESNLMNNINHIVFMPNIFYNLFNLIVVERSNYKKISQQLLYDTDWAWKAVVYGNVKDFQLLKKMKLKYKTIKDYIKEYNFIYGTGLQTNKGNKDSTEYIGKRIIDSTKGIMPYVVDFEKFNIFNYPEIHRIRRKELFNPPYVLIKKGFDTNTYKLRAAFSKDEFLYRDAITGIVGKNEEVLLNFLGLINSSLYSYFNLMWGTSTGIEREQAFPTEIIDFPAIIDSRISEKVKVIIEKLQREYNNIFTEFTNVDNDIEELDEIILDLFGLNGNYAIDYVLKVQVPLLSGKLLKKTVQERTLEEYALFFIKSFKKYLDNNQNIFVKIYKDILNHYIAMEFFITENRPTELIKFVDIKDNDNDIKLHELFTRFTISKINDKFYQIRDVINFEFNSFYILKTNDYKNWHLNRAELDFIDIIESIIKSDE